MEVKRRHSPKQKRYGRILLKNVTKCFTASVLIANGKKDQCQKAWISSWCEVTIFFRYVESIWSLINLRLTRTKTTLWYISTTLLNIAFWVLSLLRGTKKFLMRSSLFSLYLELLLYYKQITVKICLLCDFRTVDFMVWPETSDLKALASVKSMSSGKIK